MLRLAPVAVLLFSGVILVKGQNQFLREVTNPSGPSISILRGGGFPRNGQVEDLDIQPLQTDAGDPGQNQIVPQFQLADNQGLPLQNAGDAQAQPIPADPNQSNPFTNGAAGLGLRLQAEQPAQPQPPPQAPVYQQRLAPLTVTVPQLLPGQTYVDQFGRPFVYLAEPQFQVQQPQPVAQPQPAVQPQPASQPLNQSAQKQALVDKYGRKLAEIPSPGVNAQVQEVVQPAILPVAQEVLPVAGPVQVGKVAHPAATLQTYAVPAVRKVGGLAIPFAQKIVLAAKIPAKEVVYPAAVAAAALVKSRHRTVLTPQAIVQAPLAEVVHHPVAEAVHTPVVQPPLVQTHVAPAAPVFVQEPQHVVVDQHVVAHHPQQLLQVVDPSAQAVHHHLQPHAVAHHHLQPLQVVEHHAPAVLPVAHVPTQVVHPAPVAVKKVKPLVVPDVTLIHQPVLPKAAFQQHIFNVKHGSEPVIYQDLCTVYPYQKNIRACVLKKATLPELHHPDIRTVNVETQPRFDQSSIAGGSVIVAPVPVPVPTDNKPTVTVSKELPKSIQEAIKTASANAAASEAVTPTTVQPEAAESRDSSTSKPPRRSRRKNKGTKTSTITTEKPFTLQ